MFAPDIDEVQDASYADLLERKRQADCATAKQRSSKCHAYIILHISALGGSAEARQTTGPQQQPGSRHAPDLKYNSTRQTREGFQIPEGTRSCMHEGPGRQVTHCCWLQSQHIQKCIIDLPSRFRLAITPADAAAGKMSSSFCPVYDCCLPATSWSMLRQVCQDETRNENMAVEHNLCPTYEAASAIASGRRSIRCNRCFGWPT